MTRPDPRSRARRRRALAPWRASLIVLALVAIAASSCAMAPINKAAALSWNATLPQISSTYGSGDFGTWATDSFGLPSYRYTIHQNTDPVAHQSELAGSTDAWSQVGNDRVKADAFNHGYTELWSQDRLAQWINQLDVSKRHEGGGFGYLNVDGRVSSTLYDDIPKGASSDRTFGVGYFSHSVSTSGIDAHEVVYAPFGNDPVLVHDVTLTNTSAHAENVSWFEYWDVNPYVQASHQHRGLSSPSWSGATDTLSVAQLPLDGDDAPLSIFLAQVAGTTASHASSQSAFFCFDGTVATSHCRRGRPARRHQRSLPSPTAPRGRRCSSPCSLMQASVPRQERDAALALSTATTPPTDVSALVAKYRHMTDPFASSEHGWVASLPKASFGSNRSWMAREFLWDAYLLRSATVDESECGEHTITQGGYYQYQVGENLGHTKLKLQYAVPMRPTWIPIWLVRSLSILPNSSPSRRCSSPTGPPACAQRPIWGRPTISTSGSCGPPPPMPSSPRTWPSSTNRSTSTTAPPRPASGNT